MASTLTANFTTWFTGCGLPVYSIYCNMWWLNNNTPTITKNIFLGQSHWCSLSLKKDSQAVLLSYRYNVNKKGSEPSPSCRKINITNRRIPVLMMSLSLCLTPSHSHSVSPQSSTVLLSDCLFSFHETPVKLGDPVAMPAIRGVYSGSLTNHEEIDCKESKDRKFSLYPCGLKSKQLTFV